MQGIKTILKIITYIGSQLHVLLDLFQLPTIETLFRLVKPFSAR